MRPRPSPAYGLSVRRTRLAVEQYEDRIPIAESVGMGMTLRASGGAAAARFIQAAPPPSNCAS
jgi:hypothetical protein